MNVKLPLQHNDQHIERWNSCYGCKTCHYLAKAKELELDIDYSHSTMKRSLSKWCWAVWRWSVKHPLTLREKAEIEARLLYCCGRRDTCYNCLYK